MSKVLALIPARGGSKRIQRKNIRDFCGKPIISYSIAAAKESELFDKIMVSTDDLEIAAISSQMGAEIPFLRSKENSNDDAGLREVLEEVLNSYSKENLYFEYVCMILATAPFIRSKWLKEALALLKSTKCNSVIPVVQFSYPIQRALVMENQRIKMIHPENYAVRSQDLQKTYHDAGLFYWFDTRGIGGQESNILESSVGFQVSESEVQDIDTEEDWKIAEFKYSMQKSPTFCPDELD